MKNSIIKHIFSVCICWQIFCPSWVFAQNPASSCDRIISLAPSITETLFALGLGSRLVAVTRYCNYPEAAKFIQPIGGLFDANLEAALLLSPSIVIGLQESSDLLDKFQQLKVQSLRISDRSVTHLFSAFRTICDKCDCQKRAEELVEEINADVLAFRTKRSENKTVSVALIVASSTTGGAEELYLSGSDGIYSSIFEILNAKNVFSNRTAAIPSSSFETLVSLAPEVIFIVEARVDKFQDLSKRILSYLPLTKLVHLSADYSTVPGPRFPLLMRDIHAGIESLQREPSKL